MLRFFHYKIRLTPMLISTPSCFSFINFSPSLSISLARTVLMMMQIERPSILLLLGFLLLQSCMFQLAQSSTNFTDKSALIAFNSKIISGPNATVLAGNWSSATNLCNWIGISCSRRRQRITALNLSNMGLQGTISPHIGNEALCGNPIFEVSPCQSPSTKESKVKQSLLKYVLPAIASIIICLALVYMLRKHRESKMWLPSLFNTLPLLKHRMISYQELCQGTNNFCESNLLGAGGFGSVYKGMLFDGTIVAIKVLNLQLAAAFKSFDVECKVLRTIRHRNLVKVISTCSNLEFRALVLQYMSNGSLERWLYSYNYCLNLLQRVNIMIDIASALDYLHHGLSESVVHCDLKPTNIFLDEDMVAHVGDFGIAKILVENKDATQTKTLGTLGYIAPEYGFEGKVSIKGDVYSYGIILLEMITRKKPTDDVFVGELTLRQWINTSLPDKIMEVVDNGLLKTENGRDGAVIQSVLSSIMELGLKCSEELPDQRIDIEDVLVKLKKIHLTLFENRNEGI